MKKAVIFATCHGAPLRDLLSLSEDFQNEYELIFVENYVSPQVAASESVILDLLPDCELFLFHRAHAYDFDKMQKLLPRDAVSIELPYVTNRLYWPTYEASGARGLLKSEQYPWGLIPHRCRLLESLLAQGMPHDKIVEAYAGISISRYMNLNHVFYTQTMYLQDLDSRNSVIQVLPFFVENFAAKRLFHIINHPSTEIFLLMTNQILGHLGFNVMKVDPERDVLKHFQTPIHPSVLDFFDITFADRLTKYTLGPYRLDFYEHAALYIEALRDEAADAANNNE